MRFKKGDKVRVRKDLDQMKDYGGFSTASLVDDTLIGQEVTIQYSNGQLGVYLIKEDYGDANWVDEMFEPIEDTLVTKTLERNNKPKHSYTSMTIDEHNEVHWGETYDPIKPSHYRKGEIDLYESAYRTRPFNEFRAIMEFIAERYMKRDKDNRIQDLDKAIYTLSRLKEYEENEK